MDLMEGRTKKIEGKYRKSSILKQVAAFRVVLFLFGDFPVLSSLSSRFESNSRLFYVRLLSEIQLTPSSQP